MCCARWAAGGGRQGAPPRHERRALQPLRKVAADLPQPAPLCIPPTSLLLQGVQGISDIITIPGLVNVDFADVKVRAGGHSSKGRLRRDGPQHVEERQNIPGPEGWVAKPAGHSAACMLLKALHS